MRKYRIIEETLPSGEKRYCIQRKKTWFFGLIETNKWKDVFDDQKRMAYSSMNAALRELSYFGVIVDRKVVYGEKL